jgi:hypothetical protein
MDSSTLTTGTGVSEWRDKSGLGQAFSQATTGSQPALTASAISGRPGVTFNSGRFLDLGSQTIGGNNLVSAPGNPWSIYILCRSTDGSALVKTLFGKGNGQLQLAQITSAVLFVSNGANNPNSPSFPAFVNGLFTFDYNGSVVQARFNEGITGTSTPTTTTAEAVNVALGCRNASSPFQHFVGHIGEVIFYNRSLSAAERSSVVNYLSSKWGFAIPQYTPPTYADADANAYITAVETADGQALETSVRDAINNFVVGCKADGIWSAIRASCILMGARTLAGALTPLVGTAPTNNGPFVTADYVRGGASPGLKGNKTTKFLDSNRPHNSDPQDDFHCVVWCSELLSAPLGDYGMYFGSASSPVTTQCYNFPFAGNAEGGACRATSTASFGAFSRLTGLKGMSRSASASFTYRTAGTIATVSQSSASGGSGDIHFFAQQGTTANRSDARLSFYSTGTALNLALLDARLSTLVSAMANVL